MNATPRPGDTVTIVLHSDLFSRTSVVDESGSYVGCRAVDQGRAHVVRVDTPAAHAPVDISDSTHPVWSAVVEVASLAAVVAAVRDPDPEWAVSELIHASVLAAYRVMSDD